MAWRNCKASLTLAAEIDADPRFRNRDKASDGTLGDAAHASRTSDHNPWVIGPDGVGIVRARDIDEDLDGNTADTGADAQWLLDHFLKLAKAGDPRLNGGGYLIYEGKIYSERNNWAPRPYTGPNSHGKHIHVSFSRNAMGYDSRAPWGISSGLVVTPPTNQPTKGWLMALSDKQQEEVYNFVKQAAMSAASAAEDSKRIKELLEGDKTGTNMPKRAVDALTRIEKAMRDEVDPPSAKDKPQHITGS